MDQMAQKVKNWIDEKKDPRSAHWQAALGAIMEKFFSSMEPGKLTPVHALEEKELVVFKNALERVDLSPGLLAAFVPPFVANSIVPPDSAEELMRIEKEKPSYKIIILRPGKEERILCVELSEHASRPGVDIFQSGALLGSFNYETHEICLSELPKAIHAHIWEKTKWQQKDYISYTVNWLKKTEYLGSADVVVDKNYSFLHSPTLIKSNRIDALFLLIYEVLHTRFQDPEGLYKDFAAAGKKTDNKEILLSTYNTLIQKQVLDLLNLIKELKLIDFTSFTNVENEGFKHEFVRTVRKLTHNFLH
ncbi:MAG: hypothetical protein U9N77_13875 [Thermodesulfobacteriota bacterium]|nr:hypothetical protein [Thermodesulfobacteriota bacterium]